MKNIILLTIITLGIVSCNVDKFTPVFIQHKYANQSGADIRLYGIGEQYTNGVFMFNEQIPDGQTLALDVMQVGKGNLRDYGLTICDSVSILFNENKVLTFTMNSSPFNPLIPSNYECIHVKQGDYYIYEFTFTREMYDAATPIVPPTEE